MKGTLQDVKPLIHEPFTCKLKVKDEAWALARCKTVGVYALDHKDEIT
jgi:hypothetical protein